MVRGTHPNPTRIFIHLPTPPKHKESLHANFGDFGAAALLTTLQVRFYDEATHVFILRCPRDGYRSAWAAMTLLTALGGGGSGTGSGTGSGGGGGGTKASISVLHVSGSVRTCRKDAVDILVQEAAAAAADAGGQGEVEGADAKRGYYQAQIEGAIQGV